jgi:hypothetical protein
MLFCDFKGDSLGDGRGIYTRGCPSQAVHFVQVDEGSKIRCIKSCDRHWSSISLLIKDAGMAVTKTITEEDYVVWNVMEK